MSTFTTRDAIADDAPVLTDILNDAIQNGFGIWRENSVTVEEMRSYLPGTHGTGKLVLRVAIANSIVEGWASVSLFKPNYGYEHTGECSVYISDKYQGKGLGSRLVDDLYVSTKRMGSIRTLLACIDSENISSVELFKKAGYIKHGTLPEVGCKKGSWRSLHILAKRVS